MTLANLCREAVEMVFSVIISHLKSRKYLQSKLEMV